MLDRRAFVGFVTATALAGVPGARAQEASRAQEAGRAQEADPAVALVRGLYDGVRAASILGPVAARLEALAEPFARTFDYPAMMRLAYGGTRWSKVPEPRQAALVEVFTRFFNATYANRLSAAVGSSFEVQPASEPRGEGRLVRSRVTDPGGNVTAVDYVVGKGGRVTDVLLAGTVSEVASLRAEFDASVKGGGADRLEAYMRQRVEGMLAAKPPG